MLDDQQMDRVRDYYRFLSVSAQYLNVSFGPNCASPTFGGLWITKVKF